tara:strand:- start:2494 stop:2775 length:282 start_codon:yes stop_codon:yes gene_type:complete
MTSSIDRSASERVFSNQSYKKTGEELKALIHRQNEVDPYIRVRKSSVKSLRSWATHRQAEQRRELNEPQASYAEAFWNGYITALDEVLEMEKS